MNLQTTLKTVRRRLTSNTQRAALRLLAANGQWVTRSQLRIPSAAARIRDLRKQEYGGFRVECKRARDLGRNTASNVFCYRIVPGTVNSKQLATVFKI